jgi:hypothetical protein
VNEAIEFPGGTGSGQPHNRDVLDMRLVGYWSDEDLCQGAMEAADIAFRPDGTGWTYWSRDGGTFFILRFRWHTTNDQHLTLGLHEKLSGTWDLESSSTRHHVTSQSARGEQIAVTYKTTPGHNVFGKPATLLELDKEVSPGTIGDRFALKRQLTDNEHDPASRRP